MSICVKKKFLFPYLMIATTISSIEQPALANLVQENRTNFNAANVHDGHLIAEPQTNSPSLSLLNIIEQQNTLSYNVNPLKNQYLSSLGNLSDWSNKSFNYELKNDNLQSNKITKINYQLLKHSIIENKKHHVYGNNPNFENIGYAYSILLLLLSLGMIGSLAFFAYYKNQKYIKQRNDYLFNILRFNKNSGNLTFWKNQFFNNFKNCLILIRQRTIFSTYQKLKKIMVNFHISSLNQYSPS